MMPAHECSKPDCQSRLHYKEEVIGDTLVWFEWLEAKEEE